MKKLKTKKGFSLMELLVVIAISGILMAISAPKYQGMIDKAEEVQQKTYIREALNYVDVYNLETVKILDTGALSATTTAISSTDYKALVEKIAHSDKTIKSLREYIEKGTVPVLPTSP